MKNSQALIFTLAIIGISLCGWFLWRSSSSTPKQAITAQPSKTNQPYYVSEPYKGIKLDAVEISNLTAQAQLGSVTSAMKLASHYSLVQNDVTNSIKYWTIAATNGSAGAAFNIGQMYLTDSRVKDLKEAEYWFTLAQQSRDQQASEKIKEVHDILIIRSNANSSIDSK